VTDYSCHPESRRTGAKELALSTENRALSQAGFFAALRFAQNDKLYYLVFNKKPTVSWVAKMVSLSKLVASLQYCCHNSAIKQVEKCDVRIWLSGHTPQNRVLGVSRAYFFIAPMAASLLRFSL